MILTIRHNNRHCVGDKAFLLEKNIPLNVIDSHAFEQARADAIARIEAACTNHIYQQIFVGYPLVEINTFIEQVGLATEYLATPSDSSPIHQLALENNTTADAIANKIVKKSDDATPQVMAAIGKKQRLVSQIQSLTMENNQLADFDNIQWGNN